MHLSHPKFFFLKKMYKTYLAHDRIKHRQVEQVHSSFVFLARKSVPLAGKNNNTKTHQTSTYSKWIKCLFSQNQERLLIHSHRDHTNNVLTAPLADLFFF